MIRLHVLYNQIVRFAVSECVLDVVQPLMGKIFIYGVHNSNFLIYDGIRVVGHAVWNNVLSLEQVYLMVVDSDVFDITGNGHSHSPYL